MYTYASTFFEAHSKDLFHDPLDKSKDLVYIG